jgi:precorrin-2 dehydrogenase/sirohydrochlorin ferrochelatase
MFLNLKGVPCVVVGAGRVAERKIAALRRAGARVRVVAERASPRIRRLARRGMVDWIRSPFRGTHLRGGRLAIAATSDPSINRAVAREARRRQILVDVVDAPELGTFSMPAVLSRGPLQIAISTTGESPALARKLKRDVARRFGPEYGPYIRLLGAIRRRLRVEVADASERERRLRRLLRAPLLPLIRSGRIDRARREARLTAGLH